MLKSLELAGFKSFAEKTRLEFPQGVTVVVGPNGSGKSNVVDAIKWVLGSQSPRSLRGKEMTDVIFNGSGSRAPLNTAEVTLTFDNPEIDDEGNRLFDLNEPELRFTRRVYRSGEGEYLINGHAGRLKDFRELLAGTGVGADAYCIIEQGRVDAALQASPNERRGLFEEAAGISRYRLKKREAEKRLERVEQNLLRLSDIVDEVESRLRRVRSQAGKAQKFRTASEQLKEARIQLGLADRQALLTEKQRLDDQLRLLGGQLSETKRLISAQEEELSQDEVKHSEARQALKQAEAQIAELKEKITRDRTTSEHEQKRLEELDQQISSAHSRLITFQNQNKETEESKELQALQHAEQSLRDCETALSEVRVALEPLKSRVATSEKQLEELRELKHQVADDAKQAEAKHQQLQEEFRSTEKTLRIVHGDTAAQPDELQETKQRLLELEKRQQQTKGQLNEVNQELVQADELVRTQQAEIEAKRQHLTQLQGQQLAMRHRLEVLATEEQRLDALNRDVRTLLAGANRGEEQVPEVFGLVADLLHVDVDLANMVEAALGPRTNDVVVDSGELLVNAIQNQSDKLTTRTKFQTLDGPLNVTALDRIDLSDEPGVMGRASDFVESEKRFEPFLRRLLGRTWFVDRLETAVRLSRTIGRGLSFVTYAGEVIGGDGSVVVGPHEDNVGALSRSRKAEALRQTLDVTEEQAKQLGNSLQELTEGKHQSEQQVRALKQQQDQVAKQLHEVQNQTATLEERYRQYKSSTQNRKQRLEELAGKLKEIQTLMIDSSKSRESSADRLLSLSEQIARQEQGHSELERELAVESARETELLASFDSQTTLFETLLQESQEATSLSEDSQRELDRQQTELTSHIVKREQCELAILRATSRLAEIEIELTNWNKISQQAKINEGEDYTRRQLLNELLKENRAESEQLLGRVAQVELRRQQSETELRTLFERLKDHAIDLSEHLDNQIDAIDSVNREALRAEIEQLKREVDSVGSVNLESLEELDDLETRFEELSSQYEDLTKAKTSLVRLTTKINRDSRELYLASFEVIRGHFRELFQRLFGGGEADLVMVHEEGSDDPLEGGIEIVACPPGKELRNLSLLSGGEKTMTCVALLMALFRSKPSPFCVLDEVDAALDEANIGRFTNVLNEFLNSTQFIVITHSKRTMVGADTLYGITMQESGVSKQVSVRFEEVTEDGHIRPMALHKPENQENQRRAA